MAEAKRILVLCADIDDDLGEKARVKGPVVGRKDNLEAAQKLSLADPEDSDGNSIYAAIKTYDELSKTHKHVEIATVTGSAKLGYEADANFVRQLEKVISDFAPEACVFVSDGASDESIIPLVQSRVKINSVRTVTVKQTKALESTYFVILEKLKEPQVARIVFGIPGLALLLFAVSEYVGVRVLLFALGAYLILKAIGLEDRLFRRLAVSRISFDNIPFIFYFAAALLGITSLWLAFSEVAALNYAGETNAAKVVAWFLKDLFLLLPIAVLLVIAGNALQALHDKKNYLLSGHVVQVCGTLLFWLILNNASDWVIGTLSFAEFFYSLLLGIAAMYLVVYLAREFKRDVISKMPLEGKDAYTEIGGFIGKVVGINRKKETFIVQTSSGQKFDIDFSHIADLGEKIIVRY